MGSGTAATLHAQSLSRNKGFRLEAISSRNQVRGADLAKTFACRHEFNPRELIADPRIEAVILAVPPAIQPDYARQVLQRGIPLLCEKPLAPSLAAAKGLLLDGKSHPNCGINFCYRQLPEMVWLRKCLQSGVVGKPAQVRVEWILGNRLGSIPNHLPTWKREARLGGGVLMNYGIHVLDYLFFNLRNPRLEGAHGQRFSGAKSDEALAMLWRTEDCSFSIQLSLISGQGPVHQMFLRGPQGSVGIRNLSPHNPAGPFRVIRDGKMHLPSIPPASQPSMMGLFAATHQEWRRACEGKAHQLPTLTDGIYALKLADQVLRCA